ncbi:SDR family NAD(P)-dependent oxidoreductase [Mycolicibacterium sp. S2-37]|uniref:SDR family NAD(P)-dependent oxidoreductase n=1 Tax=Mycolicibacterium sp. S2-37 TaxID=2810297 RepID=UPI001A9519A0|nr:SDR family NAD(P)-dependent oxidoreductase [Mycolicibacterium sp. S2-37]MBO0676146.1 SDR family NAD(P)-dependent oxidoreductase [Mycolicibacterium sp. S2-37]
MSELRFDGRVAVVTGAGRGLGREYAFLLAARGARVLVNDLGGSVTGCGAGDDAAEQTVREIIARGGEAVADGHSVATPEGGQGIIDAALDAFGTVDILVNNAGTVDDAAFEDMTQDRLDPLLDVHLRGAFFVTRPAWKVMRSKSFGRVVNTCSAAGILGAARMSNYGSAKTGLIGLTRVLAAEAGDDDIKVNAVAPIAATRMLDYSMRSVAELADDAAAAAADEVMRPFFERLDPALVAPVVGYLSHADCTVSGDIYTVGAGQVARFFIGRTKGYYNPALSMEDVGAHLGEIRDTGGHTVPTGPADEMMALLEALAGGPTAD